MTKSSLPKGWRLVKFGDVVDNMNETTRDPASMSLDRVVGLDHMDTESLPLKRWDNFSDLHEGTSFTRVFRSGQVLFGKRRAYQRKVSVPDFDGICSGDILVFQPKNEELLSEFLPYLVQSDGFFDHALGTSAGSLSPRTKWQELAKYEFVLPPIAEQYRTVELMANLDQVIYLYQSISLHLLESAIWQDQLKTNQSAISTVGQECEIQKGKKPPEIVKVYGDGLPYLTADVLRGQRPTQFVLPESLSLCTVLGGNETLILWDGAGAGDVFHGQQGVVASTMVRVVPSTASRLLPEFLYLSLRHLSKEIKSTCRGSTVPHVAPGSLRKLQLLIASVDEQEKIISFFAAIQSLAAEIETHLKALGQLRKTCLHNLGELKV